MPNQSTPQAIIRPASARGGSGSRRGARPRRRRRAADRADRAERQPADEQPRERELARAELPARGTDADESRGPQRDGQQRREERQGGEAAEHGSHGMGGTLRRPPM